MPKISLCHQLKIKIKMKKFLSIFLFAICLQGVNAQFFKPLAKPVQPVKQQAGFLTGRSLQFVDTIPAKETNPTLNVLRPNISLLLAYDGKGNAYTMQGIGVDLTHVIWQPTLRYTESWKLGLYLYTREKITNTTVFSPNLFSAGGIEAGYKFIKGSYAWSFDGYNLYSLGVGLTLFPVN